MPTRDEPAPENSDSLLRRSSLRGLHLPRVLLGAALAVPLAACDGSFTGAPTTGTLQISAATTGDTLDADGYTVTLDGSDARSLDPGGMVTYQDVEEGSHDVELQGVQVNCDVEGETARTVAVTTSETTSEAFAVSCRAALVGRILFISSRDGDVDLYAMEPDGSAVGRVTDSGARDLTPHISSDGTRVVFDRLESDNLEIYLLDVGGDAVNLTEDPDRDIHPVLSPDGSRIAFSSDRSGDLEIWTMAVDGSDLQRLTDDPEQDVQPAWSPDGSRIAFTSRRSGDRDVYVMEADGSNLTPLTENGGDDDEPAWSPDGERIAFTSDRSGDFQIWIMDADGTGATQLTDVADWDGAPAISPDGQLVAFSSERTAVGDVFVMGIDGSGVEQLTESDGVNSQPVWTPVR